MNYFVNHLFIPYELAAIAKEKGFNHGCFAYYFSDDYTGKDKHRNLIFIQVNQHNTGDYRGFENNYVDFGKWYIAAPLYQQIVDWFRNVHGIVITVYCSPHGYVSDYDYLKEPLFLTPQPGEFVSEDYYEAFGNAIKEAFKLI